LKILSYGKREGLHGGASERAEKEGTHLYRGTMPSVQPGETIRCKGVWKHHPQFGQQFEVKSFDLEAPSDLVGIQKYLESGMIKGSALSMQSGLLRNLDCQRWM